MKKVIEKLEVFLEWDGTKKDFVCLVLGGLPIILEAIIGLVTAFDSKADVLVSLALIASVCIGEDFASGEVAFIMQLGALLEDLTVAKARADIEKLVHLPPQTARVLTADGKKILPGETVPVDGIQQRGIQEYDTYPDRRR